jgi:RNA polymerase sigma-70 factor (ECF subfamily)
MTARRFLLTVAEVGPLQQLPTPAPLPLPKEAGAANSSSPCLRIENRIIWLYAKNAAGLRRYALTISRNRELAQDAVQEAFLRFYIALRKEVAIQDDKGWLYRTVRNYVLDRLKDYSYRNGLSLGAAAHLVEDHQNPENQILLHEISSTAHELLSPRELECLRLHSEGLRYKDIADILKIHSGTVGAFLARALRKIRTGLNPLEGGK